MGTGVLYRGNSTNVLECPLTIVQLPNQYYGRIPSEHLSLTQTSGNTSDYRLQLNGSPKRVFLT